MKKKSRTYTLKDVIKEVNDYKLLIDYGYGDEVYFGDQPHICLRRANGKEKTGTGVFVGWNETGIGGPFWVKVGAAEFDTYCMIRRKK